MSDGSQIGLPSTPLILVVDDERHIVRIIQVNLERAGWKVITAYDGREALAKTQEFRPRALVLDVMMPYMDGFTLLSQIRNDPEVCGTAVIFLTAKAQDQDIFDGYHRGADFYLTKPFNPMELITFMKRILATKEDDASDTKKYEL